MARVKRLAVCWLVLVSTGLVLGGCGSLFTTTPYKLSVQNVTGSLGVPITVGLQLDNVTNVGGYHVVLSYDPTKLSVVAPGGVVPGPDVPVGSTFTAVTTTPGVIDITVSGTTPFIDSGEIAVMQFTLVAPSASGTVNPISFTSALLLNTIGGSLPVTTVPGSITTL